MAYKQPWTLRNSHIWPIWSLPLSPGRRRWVAVKAQEFWDLLGVSRVIFYFRGWIFILTKKNFRTVVRKPNWTKASGSSDRTEPDYAARASNWTELDQGLWKLGLNWTGLRCQSFELDRTGPRPLEARTELNWTTLPELRTGLNPDYGPRWRLKIGTFQRLH